MPITSKTIPNLVGMLMYYKPPEVVDPEATPIYQNWDSNIIIDEVGNRTLYDSSTNPDNVLLYSWNMEYQEAIDPPFEFDYFYVKNEDTVNINITMSKANGVNVDSYYRILPNTEWVVWPGTVTLTPNLKCEIKRDSILLFGKFRSTGLHSVGGNIMTLLYGDLTEEKTVISTLSLFFMMFDSDSNLISASNLLLPATTLATSCYEGMFRDCTSLTTAPELPATTLARSCYWGMFLNCTSLTEAPELPVTELTWGCYTDMFHGCTSLTKAPELPATTLDDGCYGRMFMDCTSLTTPPSILPASIFPYGCCENMFLRCYSLTSAPELPATTLGDGCFHAMFKDCTNLTSAPELPATELAQSCYEQMFDSCTSLTTAPIELPATILAESCYKNMFVNCTSLRNAPILPALTLVTNCYEQMFADCSNINYIKAMFTTAPDLMYTSAWVSDVASSGTFVKNSAATWNPEDYRGGNGIPNNWTVQTASS